MNDQIFIQGLKKGIVSHQERFFRENYSNVFRQTLQILKNHEDAEDATQLTFLKAYKSIKTFKGDSKISSWLFAIARFEALMILRKNKAKHALHYEGTRELKKAVLAQGYTYNQDPVLRRKIARIIPLINKKWRRTLLAKMQEYSCPEIAALFGQTIPAVKCDIHRAKAQFKQLFQEAV